MREIFTHVYISVCLSTHTHIHMLHEEKRSTHTYTHTSSIVCVDTFAQYVRLIIKLFSVISATLAS
jgi:hypothetical protein